MANRSLARLIAVQSLFAGNFRKLSENGLIKEIEYNSKTFAPSVDEETYAFAVYLIKGVVENLETLDEIISNYAKRWSIEKINSVDLAILRMSIFELVSQKLKVPPKAVINEAIELAKTLGGDSSRRFVNGVLSSIYETLKKEKKDPGNDENNKDEKHDSYENEEQRIGALVYTSVEKNLFIALIYDPFGFWTLPKGRIKDNETYQEAVVRKIKEEISLDVKVSDVKTKIGSTSYIVNNPQKGKTKVNVDYYLVKYDGSIESIKAGGSAKGVRDAKFFHINDLDDLRIYEDISNLISRGLDIIESENQINVTN